MYLAPTPTITIRVLFFSAAADAARVRETALEVCSGHTVGDAHLHLLEKYPGLKGLKVRYAVNEEYCSAFHVLADDEELAIFTAVSGG